MGKNEAKIHFKGTITIEIQNESFYAELGHIIS